MKNITEYIIRSNKLTQGCRYLKTVDGEILKSTPSVLGQRLMYIIESRINPPECCSISMHKIDICKELGIHQQSEKNFDKIVSQVVNLWIKWSDGNTVYNTKFLEECYIDCENLVYTFTLNKDIIKHYPTKPCTKLTYSDLSRLISLE